MMFFLRNLFDRVLLLAAFVAGGLVPGFIAQYVQRLGGRLDQARLDLEPWQKIADQFHGGDIEKLIQYHLNSVDPTFHSEGVVIRSLVDTVHQLQSAVAALHTTLFHQVSYLALHADPGLARATYNRLGSHFRALGRGSALCAIICHRPLVTVPGDMGPVRAGRRTIAARQSQPLRLLMRERRPIRADRPAFRPQLARY